MLFGEGRAKGGDGVFESTFVENNGVDLTFANKGKFFFAHRAPSLIEGEEEFRFVEEGSVGSVDVFSAFVVCAKDSGAESNHIAIIIVNREGELIVEFYPESRS